MPHLRNPCGRKDPVDATEAAAEGHLHTEDNLPRRTPFRALVRRDADVSLIEAEPQDVSGNVASSGAHEHFDVAKYSSVAAVL